MHTKDLTLRTCSPKENDIRCEDTIVTAKTEGLKQPRLGYFSGSHKFC